MSQPKIYSYDPDNLILIVGGIPVRPADSVVISRSNDVAIPQVGQLGDVCVAKNLDKTGTLTIPLMAQSLEDLAFDQWAGNNVFLPMLMVEKSTSKFLQTNCCYLTQPDLSFGQETDLRAHTIFLQNSSLALTDGANNLFGSFDKAFEFGEGLVDGLI